MENKREDDSNMNISDALNVLSFIAQMEDEGTTNLPVAEIERVKSISGRVKKIKDVAKEVSEDRIKEIFSTVLRYIEHIYEEGAPKSEDKIEDVRSIMALVGEAAKNLDRYSDVFKIKSIKSVTQLSDYKRLQEFYTRKVERQVDEGMLSKWIFGLTKGGPSKDELRKARARRKEKSQHVFVDLDMVKRDNEYELLLMRKEDGSRFFSPRLLRNIKLVCEFGSYSSAESDIFEKVQDWRDVMCHVAALNMLHSLHLALKRFYHEAFRYKKRSQVRSLNNAVMALMLCANPNNLSANRADKKGKTCIHYFADFQAYLREALNDRYYQKLLVYPPKPSNVLANCILSFTQNLCRAVYMHMHIMQEMFHRVHEILDEAKQLMPNTSSAAEEKGIFLWSRLAYDYAEIIKSFKKHENGPLKRILESLEEGKYAAFDSLTQHNLPHTWFNFYMDDDRLINLRMASPTRQVYINKATVLDEFKGFLLSQSQRGKSTKHLLINLQDRTSWREFSRCQAVEQLQNASPFSDHLAAATLAVDTVFFQQSGPYENQDDAEDFIDGFKQQLQSPSSGYYFPENIKKSLTSKFFGDMLHAVHKFFFNEEQYLSQKDRQSFISLVHFLMQLKLIDIIRPHSFSFSCKDGIDIGGAASVFMFAFFKNLEKENLSAEEIEFIEAMIYGPAIFIRERAILPEPLNRMLSTMQVVEGRREAMGFDKFRKELRAVFDPLFKKPILAGKAHIPTVELERQVPEAA